VRASAVHTCSPPARPLALGPLCSASRVRTTGGLGRLNSSRISLLWKPLFHCSAPCRPSRGAYTETWPARRADLVQWLHGARTRHRRCPRDRTGVATVKVQVSIASSPTPKIFASSNAGDLVTLTTYGSTASWVTCAPIDKPQQRGSQVCVVTAAMSCSSASPKPSASSTSASTSKPWVG
jgi:hypothetical protein